MTLLDALAAAARDCLLDGRAAPLPGLGTLTRAHVSARMSAGPDGTRVLLPPGAAVGLSARVTDPTAIAQALVRHTGAPAEASAAALRDAVDPLEARLAVTGEVRLAGVGAFQRTSGGVRFGADPDLVAAINRPYAGLAPVAVAAVSAPAAEAPEIAEAAPAVSPAPRAAPRPVPVEESGAVDILLDLIVNEPAEPAEAPSAPRPAEPALAEAAPVTVGPSESAFADDDAADDAATMDDDRDASFDDLPDVSPAAATTAEIGAEAPHRHVAAEWHPGPETHAEAAPRPLDAPADGIEDADYEVAPSLAAPREPDEPGETDEDAGLDLASDEFASDTLADDPPETAPLPAPDARPDLEHASELTAVPGPPSAARRRTWAALYTALVLGLAALLLWWTLDERRADPQPATGPAAVLAFPL